MSDKIIIFFYGEVSWKPKISSKKKIEGAQGFHLWIFLLIFILLMPSSM